MTSNRESKGTLGMTKYSAVQILECTVLILVLLYFGRTLFIPLGFASLISFILYPLCVWMEKKKMPRSVAILLCILGIGLLFGVVIYFLYRQVMEFSHEWLTLKSNFLDTMGQLGAFISEEFGISVQDQKSFLQNSINNSGSQGLEFLKSTAFSVTEFLYLLFIIPLLSALILYYRRLLVDVLYSIFPSDKKETVYQILIETIRAYYKFIKGMLWVYLIVGVLNSIGLAIIGVPHAILFGFIASILTFIPYVGIIISSLLPIAVSWVTFNSVLYPLAVILVFTIVQVLEAYVIFPLAVGGRLKINTLVIIIVIIAGGILWGAAGMILFIPLISIVKLISERSERLKTLSVLLGGQKEDKASK